MSKIDISQYETKAEQVIKTEQIPGASVAIEVAGERQYNHGFGYRHVDKQLPVTSETIFGIASMTKSFACVAIMQLQEAGKLSVQDPVIKHLPDFRVPNSTYTDKITLHHLMTHTSGIPPLKTHVFARKRSIDQDPAAKDYGLNLVDNDGDAIDTFDQLIDYLGTADYELLGEPGTEFSYSNDTYGLLGIIIEKVSGQTFEQYVAEHIFDPCGMENSFILLDNIDKYENITELYIKKQTETKNIVYAAPLWWDAPAMRAAGYIKSTADDILKYLQSFITADPAKRILSTESIEQMFYPHFEYETGKFYGYGFRITPNYIKGMTLIDHGGGLKGVSSMMCIVPEKRLTGVVLTNISDVSADKLLLGYVNNYLALDFDYDPLEFVEKDIQVYLLEKAAGTYVSGEGMKVQLVIDKGRLAIQNKGKLDSLHYIGDLTFIHSKSKRPLRLIVNELGQVHRIFYQSRQINKVQ